MIPKDFNPRKASTQQLKDLHARLDEAIGADSTMTSFKLPIQGAKNTRCAIKAELCVRKRRGDKAATDYLARRELMHAQKRLSAVAAE